MTDTIRVACVSESEADAERLTGHVSGEGGRINGVETPIVGSVSETVESVVESNIDCIVFDYHDVDDPTKLIREVRHIDSEFPVLTLIPETEADRHGLPLTTLSGATDYVLVSDSDTEEWKSILENRIQNAVRMYLRGQKNDTHEELQEHQRDLINDISEVLGKEILPRLQFTSEYLRIASSEFTVDEESEEVTLSDPERVMENISDAENSLSQLYSLIDDLHTLSVSGVDVDELVSVSLREVATDVWSDMEVAVKHDCDLDVEPNLTIEASEKQLSRLFRHAFQLSFQRAEEDDEIVFEVDTLPESNGFYIEDNLSVPDPLSNVIMDGDAFSSHSISGIDLLIIEHVAEAHDWEFSLTESVDGGLRFEFVIA